jgi:invasion protein IalB
MTRAPKANHALPLLALAQTMALLVPVGAAVGATKVAGKFGAWAVHVNEGNTGKLCFAAAEPKERTPVLANRAASLVYISAWPKDGVKSEVSVKLGYKIKAGSKVAVLVGSETFKLAPAEERAYVADGAVEQKLVAAMRKGATMTVQALPEKGGLTTDTYSLSGLAQALEEMGKACGL